jgi:hypothetical protein
MAKRKSEEPGVVVQVSNYAVYWIAAAAVAIVSAVTAVLAVGLQ